jgi:pimeloyl-ACP methyl ester carboxylesterase
MSETSPSRISRISLGLTVPYRDPQPGLESIVAGAFEDAFNVYGVGADDDFYDLGGDSLLGETLSMEILNRTGRTFQVSWFYEDGSPAKVTRRLQATGSAGSVRPPLFMVHGMGGYSSPKSAFRDALGREQKLEVFELPGLRGDQEPCDTIEQIAGAYVGRILASYPEGPIVLGGFCTGALISLAMASQLEQIGRPVAHMILMDPGEVRLLRDRHRREMMAAGTNPGWQPRPRRLLYQLGWAMMSLLTIGRTFTGYEDRDFTDERLRKLRVRVFLLWDRLGEMARRTSKPKGFSRLALVRLQVAYLHYWPAPYKGSVDVLCSSERKHLYGDNEFWARFLPKRNVMVVGATHSEVIQGASPSVGEVLRGILESQLFGASVHRDATVSADYA